MILLPGILMVILYRFYRYKNKKVFGVISFLYAIYCVMTLVAVLSFFLKIDKPIMPMSIVAILYFCFGLFIILSVFFQYRDYKIKSIYIENFLIFRLFEYLLIIGGFFSFIFYLPFAVKSLTGNVGLNRLLGINNEVMKGFGIVNSLATLFANLFILMLLCAFLELILCKKGYKRRAVLLLISSLSFIINILAFVGRDGFVYWLLSFLFAYFLLKEFLSKNIRKRIFFFFIIVVSIASIPFVLISLSRFGAIKDTVDSFISYSGQQVVNFNDRYIINAIPRRGASNFPFVVTLLESIGFRINPVFDNDLIYYSFFQKGAVPWVFSTFIGSFLSDFGKVGTIFVLFILFVLIRWSIMNPVKSGIFTFSRLILFTLLFQFVSWGVFYNRLAVLNFYTIVMVLISLVFYLSRLDTNCLWIYKYE